jgi:hypothetical protein
MTVIPNAGEIVVFAGKHDNTFHVGAYAYNQIGTHGNAWNSSLKRYVRRITTNNTGGYLRLNDVPEPRAIVDPRYGTGAIVRAREYLCVTHTAAAVPPALNTSQAYWGFGGMPNGFSTALTRAFPFVGFRMMVNAKLDSEIAANAVWRMQIIDENLNLLYDVSTGINAQTPHEFAIVLDGTTNSALFYIDNALTGGGIFVSNQAPGQVTPYPTVGTAADRWQLIYASSSVASAGTCNMVFDFHFGPATPLMTVEYRD